MRESSGAGRPERPRSAERPLSDYFCVADGRTAALFNSDGGCDFWCWPQFDGQLGLAALLDRDAGGSVRVGPPRTLSAATGWEHRSRLVRCEYGDGLRIRCGLFEDGAGGSAIAWLAEGRPGAPVSVQVQDAAAVASSWAVSQEGLMLSPGRGADGPGGPLALVSSRPGRFANGRLALQLGPEGLLVWLGGPGPEGQLPPRLIRARTAPEAALGEARETFAVSCSTDARWLESLHRGPRMARVVGEAPGWVVRAIDRSLLTLKGLQGIGSGLLVASPTTSLPQWPCSQRAWDYRYAWLRDCADAGLAFASAGAWPEAEAVAVGLARVFVGNGDLPAPVGRLSGAPMPDEHFVSALRGYSGAPVRVGNRAAEQTQLDTLGEVTWLAGELAGAERCPPDLLRLVPRLATAAAQRWQLPDHGIWEVRGEARNYVHSKVMAWKALHTAAELAQRGLIDGNYQAWRREAGGIRATVAERGRGAGGELVIAYDESGVDSSLLAAYLVGYLRLDEPDAAATLQRVSDELGRGPLMARHVPERDGIDVPCLPFVFTGLWAARAEAQLGRTVAARERLSRICGLAGAAGQLSEVADVEGGALWGNYPQVQSHAALIEAILAIWPAERGGRV